MVDAAQLPAPEALDAAASPTDAPLTRAQRRRQSKDAQRPRHFPCFDGLRAIAAVLVVMVHTSFGSGFTLRSWAGIYTARFEIGVSVFFLISGFLLYRPFAASHIAGTPSPVVGRFWARRFLRIMPAYWLAFVVTSYFMHANPKVVPGWHAVLIYLGLVQVYVPSQALTGISQSWSLCTEIAFYLFLPLWAAVVGLRRRSDRGQLTRELTALGALYLLGLAVRVGLFNMHSPTANVAVEWLPACFDLFALGMGLAVLSSWMAHRGTQPRWMANPLFPWVSWGLAIGLLWAVAHIGVSPVPLTRDTPWRGVALEVLYGLFAFFLLLPAVFGPQRKGLIRRALQSPPMVGLGVVSYGVYLWHQAWGEEFLRWTHAIFRVAFPEMFGVVLALSIATATASYLIFERPLLKLKGRLGWWGGNRRSRPSIPVAAHGPARAEA
jgi:peptidoglycan/LPS O-acetylase OafA/YrhL